MVTHEIHSPSKHASRMVWPVVVALVMGVFTGVVVAPPAHASAPWDYAIVKQGQNTSDPTSWLLVGGQRYWIPSGGVYNCLRSSGVPGPYLLSNAELDARPDQTGQHADCGQGNDPRGYLDAVWSPGPGKVGVRGWTTDPNVRTRSIDVHVYVGGPAGSAAAAGFNIGATKAYRPDVNSAFPACVPQLIGFLVRVGGCRGLSDVFGVVTHAHSHSDTSWV